MEFEVSHTITGTITTDGKMCSRKCIYYYGCFVHRCGWFDMYLKDNDDYDSYRCEQCLELGDNE